MVPESHLEITATDPAANPDALETIQPYLPGVPARKTLRASLLRFLPSSVLSLGSVLGVLLGVVGPVELVEFAAVVVGMSTVLAGGYWIGLTAMRRWLYPDAEVEGRRSVIAGLLSPVALFSSAVIGYGASPLAAFAMTFFIGFAMALVMFFAWLTPTPDRLLADAVDRLDPDLEEAPGRAV